MNTSPLNELLALTLGLDAETAGQSFLKRVAKRSLEESGYPDLETFVGAAAAGGDALRILLDNAVVSETWFLRDRQPFEHLAGVVRAVWRGMGSAPIRILSCPCSTGEEPYSVAIALDKAGLSPEACTIDAADVSLRALTAARAGVFGARSFREQESVDRTRYFEHQADTRNWRIKPAYRAMVQFRQANLVSFEGLEDAGLYDIVLCRNLLIYLHAEARARVMTGIRKLLAPGGVLIVGHAEAAIAREHGFKGDGKPAAFAFLKTDRPSPANAPRSMTASRVTVKGTPAVRVAGLPRHDRANSVPVGGETRTPVANVTLQDVQKLGDAGRTEEAIQACQEYLRRTPDSADAYFLLGLLYGAVGRDDAAAAALRRALYLQPDHAVALEHLALAQNALGEDASASRLRARRNRSQHTSRSEG